MPLVPIAARLSAVLGRSAGFIRSVFIIFLFGEVFPLITFLLALAALITGYFIYGRIVDHFFGPDDRQTPATIHNDGVDYIPLPTWKVFLIQLLNIAGLGPIFVLLAALSGVHPFTYGLSSVPFSPAAYMTTSPA